MSALSRAAGQLQVGDLLVEVEGGTVCTFGDVEEAVDAAADAGKKEVAVTVIREKMELQLHVGLTNLTGRGTTRVIFFGGMVCQHHHWAVERLGYVPENSCCVYVSFYFYGSPAGECVSTRAAP